MRIGASILVILEKPGSSFPAIVKIFLGMNTALALCGAIAS
jgi:hypothetical protein